MNFSILSVYQKHLFKKQLFSVPVIHNLTIHRVSLEFIKFVALFRVCQFCFRYCTVMLPHLTARNCDYMLTCPSTELVAETFIYLIYFTFLLLEVPFTGIFDKCIVMSVISRGVYFFLVGPARTNRRGANSAFWDNAF